MVPGLVNKYDDNDDFRRIFKTPGDPFGCTRQHSRKNCSPSPWFQADLFLLLPLPLLRLLLHRAFH